MPQWREPFPVFRRLKRHGQGRNCVLLALCLTCGLASPGSTAPEAGGKLAPYHHAEAALARLRDGNPVDAARRVQAALQTAPDNALLHSLAGTLLLRTGNPAAAQRAFQRALAETPDNALAHYGLGLSYLALGKRGDARNCFQSARLRGGDPTHLLVAQSYVQWLEGAQLEIGGAFVPEPLIPAQQAIQGMSRLRLGDWTQAAQALQGAVKHLPGSPVGQPDGLLMTFEATHPLEFQAVRLPSDIRLEPASKEGASSQAFRGELRIEPDSLSADATYVTFEVDGRSLGIVNVRPFAYTWDTRTVADGWHRLSVVIYDGQGRELTRTERKLRIYNPEQKILPGGTREQTSELQNALWQALTLHPMRCTTAYHLGSAQRALGQTEAAQRAFLQAVALRPDWNAAQAQLAATGGIAPAGNAFWGAANPEKLVALTFDDGPRPGHTERLLQILAEHSVPATFFVIGRHVVANPELARKITAAGHEMANHSFTHPNLTRLNPTQIAREILQTQVAVQVVTGQTPRFLRPPGGNWNPKVAAVSRAWGLTPCMWTVDAYGAELQTAQKVANIVLGQVRPGSIILMHNGKSSTLLALPTILKELQRRGFTCVTTTTLFQRAGQNRQSPPPVRKRIE